ncbi:hypothetical protein ACQBAU_16210 [Propionibacteriaceae bacterium Y2011]
MDDPRITRAREVLAAPIRGDHESEAARAAMLDLLAVIADHRAVMDTQQEKWIREQSRAQAAEAGLRATQTALREALKSSPSALQRLQLDAVVADRDQLWPAEHALGLVRAELRAEAFIRDAEGRSITPADLFALAATFTVEWVAQVVRDRDARSGDQS